MIFLGPENIREQEMSSIAIVRPYFMSISSLYHNQEPSRAVEVIGRLVIALFHFFTTSNKQHFCFIKLVIKVTTVHKCHNWSQVWQLWQVSKLVLTWLTLQDVTRYSWCPCNDTINTKTIWCSLHHLIDWISVRYAGSIGAGKACNRKLPIQIIY